jgi:phage terminase small subunit
MARISAEARSGASYRAGGEAPEPPSYMSAEARKVWREITASRPVDFFDAGSAVLLESFVVFAVHGRAVLKRMADAGETDNGRLTRQAALIGATLAALASKLRLTVQARVDRKSRIVDEDNRGAADDLLGGDTRKPN